MQHLAEVGAQRRNFYLADVHAVNENLSLLNVIIPADKGQNRGFARAGRANEGHGLLGVNMEADALQHPFVLLVAEPHILKFNLALDFLHLNGIRRIYNFRLHVQNGENLLGGGKGLLQHIKLLGQRLNGIEKFGNIHIECHHNLAGDGLPQEGNVLNAALAADVKKEQVAGDKQHIHHGTENAKHQGAAEFCLGQLAALVQKFLHLHVLPVEDLGDFHAGEVLGQVGVHIRAGVVHPAVHLPAEPLEDDGKQR